MAATAGDVWEYRPGGAGDANSGGGFAWTSLVNSTYKWTASGSGTDEYYVELSGGGDPSLTEAKSVFLDGDHNLATNGTLGSLSVSEWDWGDNDTLGYSTVYVRLADGADPDTKNAFFVGFGAGGGQDYSQQDVAQLQLTDLATGGIGSTALSSVTGGFTALMVDNYFQLRSGTNDVPGFYRITAVADTNNATIDRAADDGVGGVSSGSGDLGGALDIILEAFVNDANTLIAGNTIYLKVGTMTLAATVSGTKDGTVALPITLEGYNTTRGDDPAGANRPTIAAAANIFIFDNLWVQKNLIITLTHSSGVRSDDQGTYKNLKVVNSSGTGGRPGVRAIASEARVISCDMASTNGTACVSNQSGGRIVGNYIHDSSVGVALDTNAANSTFTGNVFDTCTTGITGTSVDNCIVSGNTFYACTTAIAETNGDNWLILNNIFDANTDGLKWTTLQGNNISDHNVFDNTTDLTLFNSGPNDVFGDPGLTDPANGDFTLGGGSNAEDTGLDANDLTGATV